MSDCDHVMAAKMVSRGIKLKDAHRKTKVPMSTLYRWQRQGVPERPGVSGRLPAEAPESTRVSIRLSPNAKDRLDKLATERGQSREDVIEAAICSNYPAVMRLLCRLSGL